ncbi:hypothetical protein [Streptomyces sp. NPDC001401]|uniref:hypothetical protein n=1 Tax=Streptomyces sp. NPDC001401 TaxID=3364570 RepID=UPI00368D1AED
MQQQGAATTASAAYRYQPRQADDAPAEHSGFGLYRPGFKNAQLVPDEERCRSRNQQANADAAKRIWCHWRRFQAVAIGSTLAGNSEAPDKQSGTQHEQERADNL